MAKQTTIDDISIYMRQIEDFGRITVEEELELFNKIHGEDKQAAAQAREKLICSNLKLVVKIAHDFKNCGISFADLVAEGNAGLCIAADKFNPGKGAKFSCYAAWWIKQAMRHSILMQARTIRIPQGTAQKMYKVQRAAESFLAHTDKEASIEELAKMTGFSEDLVTSLLANNIETLSLEETVKVDGHTTFTDMTEEVRDDSEEAREVDEKVDTMLDMLSRLTDFDQLVLKLHFGIHGPACADVVIAQELGIALHSVYNAIQTAQKNLRELMDIVTE